MTKHIRLVIDYDAYPIWDDDEGGGDIDPKLLPISEKLAQDLYAWVDLYMGERDPYDVAYGTVPSEDEKKAFEKEG
ncbi:MAG: hypothetical protein AAGG02_18900, partial [Cyanobacteria bacterium P01_H01_bin.15]